MDSNDRIRIAASLIEPTRRRDPWGDVEFEPPTDANVARAHAHAATAQAETLTEILAELTALRVALTTPVRRWKRWML